MCGCCWIENATVIASSSRQLSVVVVVLAVMLGWEGVFCSLFFVCGGLLIENATFITNSSRNLFVVVVVVFSCCYVEIELPGQNRNAVNNIRRISISVNRVYLCLASFFASGDERNRRRLCIQQHHHLGVSGF